MVYYAFGNINNVHRTFYVDRKVERDRLAAILQRGGSAIIKGRPRVGKSAFVEKFKERFSGEFRFAYIICKGTAISYDSDVPPWVQLRSNIEEEVPRDAKRCGRDDRPYVLVLDEFNHLITTLKDISQTKLLDVLNYLNDLLRDNVRLVLVTQMSMYEMVAKFPALLQALPASETMDLIDIMPFSIGQTNCYCRHSKAKVDKIAIEKFYKITDGLVGGLNVLLQNYNLNCETITAQEIVSDPDVIRKLEELGCVSTVSLRQDSTKVADVAEKKRASGGESRLNGVVSNTNGRIEIEYARNGKRQIVRVKFAGQVEKKILGEKKVICGVRRYTITNQNTWDVLDRLLDEVGKKGLKEGWIPWDTMNGGVKVPSRVFRGGKGAWLFYNECMIYDRKSVRFEPAIFAVT